MRDSRVCISVEFISRFGVPGRTEPSLWEFKYSDGTFETVSVMRVVSK